VLSWDPDARRAAARRRAERYPWSATVARMLAVHAMGSPAPVRRGAALLVEAATR